jgi:hypothetical protein
VVLDFVQGIGSAMSAKGKAERERYEEGGAFRVLESALMVL